MTDTFFCISAYNISEKRITMNSSEIHSLVEKQQAYFNSNATLSVPKRIDYLRAMKDYVIKHENEIYDALYADLGKSCYESYMCELNVVIGELNHMIKHLPSYSKRKFVPTVFGQQLAKSYVYAKPYGVTLIMSPWNYPIMLTIPPVIAAVAAGNTCVVKPSAYSPACSAFLKKMFSDLFPEEYVAVVEGGREENASLLDEKFDYIFFTGSKNVGKLVLQKAANNLTPVTLELGGKSPVVVDETANLPMAARRFVFGKGTNLGQTCVAPDYVYVHESVKDKFINLVKAEIKRQFGDCLTNSHYGKIINEKHFDRVCNLIDPDKVVFGGKSDRETRKIELTVMDNVTWDDKVMKEEIFGPVIPILTYKNLSEVVDIVRAHDKPLALYVFSSDKNNIAYLQNSIRFGGGCVNECLVHVISSTMPFGGIGESGMGQYHGKFGFDTFTHYTGIMDKTSHFDLDQRYMPYNRLNLLLAKNLNFGSRIPGKTHDNMDMPFFPSKEEFKQMLKLIK